MKVLTITCKSTDEDDEFKTELDIIIKQLSQGSESGFDICENPDGTSPNAVNSYHYSIEYTDTRLTHGLFADIAQAVQHAT